MRIRAPFRSKAQDICFHSPKYHRVRIRCISRTYVPFPS